MNLTNKNKYIIYVDESNILSKTGHSVYVGVFIFYVHKDIISDKVFSIESDLKISYTHWSEMPWKLRMMFAENISNLDFVCKVFICENPITQHKVLQDFLLKIKNIEDSVIKIIIDGKKGKKAEEKLKKFLKNNGFNPGDLKFVDDKKEVLVRLADFIAGTYRSYLDNKNKENVYIFNLLKHKIKILN